VNSIFKKGLLLIAAPLVFQVVFLAVLLWNEQQNADAERWALHTREVIGQAEAAMRLLVQESSRVRGLVITEDSHFSQRSGPTATSAAEELRRLVRDNPRQQRRVEAFLASASALESWYSNLEELVRSGRAGDSETQIRSLRGERLLQEAEAEINALLAEEQQLDRERLSRLDRIRSQQRWLLLGSAASAVTIAILLAWSFARDIRSRIAVLTTNAGRLAENAPLVAPVGGHDEIARLDTALHRTARRLAEASAAEQRYKTELERHAAELAHANEDLRFKTQEIETFVYSVSHDLRSPLVNLQGFSRELEHSCKELQQSVGQAELPPELRQRLAGIDGDMAESVRYILTAVSRLGNIIDALLRLSRAGRVEYQWQGVDVGAVVRRVVDAMRGTIEAKQAEVTAGELPPAWGDPTAVEQIFGNLLSNALNYLDPKRPGRIEIGAEKSSPGSPVIYFVRDNGLGIPEPYQSKLFVAFQRLHGDIAPGEGIGLALVRRIVERHGGKIRAESQQGVGTTFLVTLPGVGEGTMSTAKPMDEQPL
jgi:signal transduction histidine kinase